MTFGHTVLDYASPVVLWEIDYGDGKRFSADTRADAERDLFWHRYSQPGSYRVMLTVTTERGERTVATCDFRFAWTSPPETTGQGGGGSAGGSGGSAGGSGTTGSWAGCYFNGVPMWGNVKVVDYFPDFEVKVVDYFEDLKVQAVDNFPDSCGKWQFVDYFEDFSIKFVDYFEDFSIKFVDYFPGR